MTRKHGLTPDERRRVVEARRAGVTLRALVKRFGVGELAIKKAIAEARAKSERKRRNHGSGGTTDATAH